jgi:FAD/FMN-containing dehydrogenase
MTDNRTPEDVINRRAFLRQGGAVGVGLGMALDGSTFATASGTPDCRTPSGSDVVPVPPAAISDLRMQLGRAKVLAPEDSAYATAGLPMNGRYRKIRPAVIARCADERDVVTCVKWCNKHGVSPVGRGGGHSYAGYSTTTGLLIDIGGLNSVKVFGGGRAVVGGAALNRNVYEATNGSLYFLPVGTCLGVGVGGLVLGGGIGYNTRWAGLTSDCLVSTQIVTASGDFLEANRHNNEDLYWACRGAAGGSFGINTSFTFDLKAVPREDITYFRFQGRGADLAARLFDEFHRLMATGVSRLNAVARAQAVKIGAGGPREAIDVMSRGQFIGPQSELLSVLSSFPLLKRSWVMKEMPFWEAANEFNGNPSPSHSFGDISRYANKPVSDAAISKQIELLVKCPSRSDVNDDGPSGSMWSLGWVGGNYMNSRARTETAYVHRNMSTLLRPTCAWPDDAAREGVDDAPGSVGGDLLAWTEEMIAAIAPETPHESYQNFPNRLIKDWKQQYYAENLDRLMQVKSKYDPGNLFNNAQSIPPKPV